MDGSRLQRLLLGTELKTFGVEPRGRRVCRGTTPCPGTWHAPGRSGFYHEDAREPQNPTKSERYRRHLEGKTKGVLYSTRGAQSSKKLVTDVVEHLGSLGQGESYAEFYSRRRSYRRPWGALPPGLVGGLAGAGGVAQNPEGPLKGVLCHRRRREPVLRNALGGHTYTGNPASARSAKESGGGSRARLVQSSCRRVSLWLIFVSPFDLYIRFFHWLVFAPLNRSGARPRRSRASDRRWLTSRCLRAVGSSGRYARTTTRGTKAKLSCWSGTTRGTNTEQSYWSRTTRGAKTRRAHPQQLPEHGQGPLAGLHRAQVHLLQALRHRRRGLAREQEQQRPPGAVLVRPRGHLPADPSARSEADEREAERRGGAGGGVLEEGDVKGVDVGVHHGGDAALQVLQHVQELRKTVRARVRDRARVRAKARVRSRILGLVRLRGYMATSEAAAAPCTVTREQLADCGCDCATVRLCDCAQQAETGVSRAAGASDNGDAREGNGGISEVACE
eukprot:1045726-Prorocentrum_minimum.AAC.2